MPRESLFGEAAIHAIRVRVTPGQRRDLQQVARDNCMDVSGVIRDAVNTFVADYRDRQPVFRGPQRRRGVKMV